MVLPALPDFFGNDFAVIDVENDRKISGNSLYDELAPFTNLLKNVSNQDILYIDMGRSVATVFAIIECLRRNIAFTFNEENLKFPNYRTTCIFDGREVKRVGVKEERNMEIAYVITTSGTTGDKKQVAVPTTCISLNVHSFIQRFQMNSKDIILFSTSLSFDPSMIELYICFVLQCRLVVCPDDYRSQPHKLAEATQKWKPTFGQFTPAVFRMLPNIEEILGPNSSFRTMLIGGSEFPLQTVKSNRSSQNKTRIFDVYGVTEVSVWATTFEVQHDCSRVYIGEPVEGSIMKVDEKSGELLIAGERQCYVNGIKTTTAHNTGDLVSKEGDKYVLIGRNDSQVKFKGVQMNLDSMNREVVEKLNYVENAHFLIDRGRFLVMFVKLKRDAEKQKILEDIRKIFDRDEFQPSRIEILNSMPLNQSGKIDERKLRRKIGKETKSFYELLCRRLEIPYKTIDENQNKSFIELGVDSLLATELALSFYSELEKDEDDEIYDRIKRFILSRDNTIAMFNEKWGSYLPIQKPKTILEAGDVSWCRCEVRRQPRMKWAHNMRKCIDGNPLVFKSRFDGSIFIAAASHSGIVMVINFPDGKIKWKIETDVRWEASPIEVDGNLVIGGYDGCVYMFDSENGEVLWRCQTEDVIKAPCTYDEKKWIYCISYDKNLYKTDKKSGEVHWKCFIKGGSPASPTLFQNDIFVSTNVGFVHRIAENSGTVLWSWKSSPILSKLTVVKEDNGKGSIILGSVKGTVSVLCAETGDLKSEVHLDSPLLCAPIFIDRYVYFVSHDGYFIRTNFNNLNEVQKFRFAPHNFKFARTPRILNSGTILLVSTDGHLLFVTLQSDIPKCVDCFKISNSEVFSMPEIVNKKYLVTTGRDDWIRCFDLKDTS